MSFRVDCSKVAAHSIAKIELGPVVFGTSRIAWRDLTITNEDGKVCTVELFASGGDPETLAARLRIVGDPVAEQIAEPAPVVEPVPATDYVEGDAC